MRPRPEIYAQILKWGLLQIRNDADAGKTELCSIEANHLHNMPSLIDEDNEQRHKYYFESERTLYLEHLKSQNGIDTHSRAFRHAAIANLRPNWKHILPSPECALYR